MLRLVRVREGSTCLRAVTRTLVVVRMCIFIYSLPALQFLCSNQIQIDEIETKSVGLNMNIRIYARSRPTAPTCLYNKTDFFSVLL